MPCPSDDFRYYSKNYNKTKLAHFVGDAAKKRIVLRASTIGKEPFGARGRIPKHRSRVDVGVPGFEFDNLKKFPLGTL